MIALTAGFVGKSLQERNRDGSLLDAPGRIAGSGTAPWPPERGIRTPSGRRCGIGGADRPLHRRVNGVGRIDQLIGFHLALVCAVCLLRIAPVLQAAVPPPEPASVSNRTETGPFARVPALPEAAAKPSDDPPLWNGLGQLSYPITTEVVLAQNYFDQGIHLADAFNHDEARRAFQAAQRHDPQCAMCFWGEALVLGPNINAPMRPEAGPAAWEALNHALVRKKRTSLKEQALIEALATRYSEGPSSDRAALDRAYAAAMGLVAGRFPDDDRIASWYAEALMDLSPWDYWEAGGAKPKGATAEIVSVLETVLRRNPEHPGAIHLYLHIVEASSDPRRAEPHADRLARLTPGAGHLVHMPSHIYYRIGRYRNSLENNRAAVRIDEEYLARTKADGLYSRAYYPHNVHFLMVSAQMAGDGPTALAAADKLARIIDDGTVRTVPWVQPIKAAPYFVHVQFSDPAVLSALPDPGAQFPYVRAMWHYARGIGAARAQRSDTAEQETSAIGQLAACADLAALEAGGIPAREVLRLAAQVLRARIAQTRGDAKAAAAELAAAAAMEDKLPYMEPPYWYSPVRQSLGAAQLSAGDLGAAEQSFRAGIERTPNNAWSLFGLAEVLRRQGRAEEAEVIRQRFQRAWLGADGPPSLDRL